MKTFVIRIAKGAQATAEIVGNAIRNQATDPSLKQGLEDLENEYNQGYLTKESYNFWTLVTAMKRYPDLKVEEGPY